MDHGSDGSTVTTPGGAETPSRDRRTHPVGAVAAAAALTTLLIGLLALSWTTAAGLMASLVLLGLSGAAVWRRVHPAAQVAELVVFGTATGLALVGAGTILSGTVDVYWVRWLPPALGLAAALPLGRRRPDGAAADSGPGAAWWGAAAASALLTVSVARHLATLPGPTDSWWSWYVDLPWHMAFTAEALERTPEVYPWVPDVSLGYTWSFSAALGGWGSLTGVSAEDLVVRVAPALLMALVPGALTLLTWEISRSRTAAAAAPVVFVLARAPLFSFQAGMAVTPQWLIPNRDYSDLFVLLSVHLLVLGMRGRREDEGPLRLAPLATLLALAVFTAASSKGSALPAVTGAAGVLLLRSLLLHRGRARSAALAAAVVSGALLAQFGVTRSLSYLRVDPMTFLGGQEPPGTGELLPWAVLALLAAVLAHLAATALLLRDLPASGGLLALAGAAAGGVCATALFGHPGLSQLYFLHAVWPLVCSAVCISAAAWAARFGRRYLVGVVVAALVSWVVIRPPEVDGVRSWAWGAAGLLVVVTVVHLWPIVVRRPGDLGVPPTTSRVAVAVTMALGAAFTVQNWGLPGVVLPAATPGTAQLASTLSADQHAVLRTLHRVSAPADLVMTNKHCQTGTVAAGDCDPRWFAVSAFAERRVLVEGWSYTRLSGGVPLEDVYWRPDLLTANDAFLAAPDLAGCQRFTELGVQWAYVDTREPWSPDLDRYADVVEQTPDAILYRLRPGCA